MKSQLSRMALAVGASLFVVPTAVAQTELPSGVTEEMIATGETIFKGAGICFTCHGQDAKGVPGLGADLTDTEWVHADGSYEKIVATILSGVTSSTGAVMPPKGGPPLTDDQVKAVAAYVWSLSNQPSK
ncbi:MAG: c-type cytochrome [Gemmatimonadota bacterium]|nr:MAG: c-type cytochrome [Gemmatimonadota bacterium]